MSQPYKQKASLRSSAHQQTNYIKV